MSYHKFFFEKKKTNATKNNMMKNHLQIFYLYINMSIKMIARFNKNKQIEIIKKVEQLNRVELLENNDILTNTHLL